MCNTCPCTFVECEMKRMEHSVLCRWHQDLWTKDARIYNYSHLDEFREVPVVFVPVGFYDITDGEPSNLLPLGF
jgi:hypothetical protein